MMSGIGSKKKNMNKEIEKYKVYTLTVSGKLVPSFWIKSVLDYDHDEFNLHHYIPFSNYIRNEDWYKQRGIEQKLILMKIETHKQVHLQAVKNLSDEEFKEMYKISRWELIFNRRHTEYQEAING